MVQRERAAGREAVGAGGGGGRQRANLKWELNMVRAKAGMGGSRMAVPKRVAQKKKAALRKSHNGAMPAVDEEVRARLADLEEAQRKRRRHHATKVLQQTIKKAKAFHLRKLIRKANDRPEKARGPALEAVALLKAMPPAWAAAAALDSSDEAAPIAAADTDEWAKRREAQPALCSSLLVQLLETAAV